MSEASRKGFDPDLPLSMITVADALVVPFGSDKTRGTRRPAGVLDVSGRHVPEATCLRDQDQPVTTPPRGPVPEPQERLSGTWLFGGMLYGHFGHFLCESTARLWPLAEGLPDLRGIVFLPKPRLTRPARLIRPVRPWLDMLGVSLPVAAPMQPTLVERLVVPEQGFGTGQMVAGRPQFRAWARAAFGTGIAPEGAERLYISRSRLYSRRGRMLGEPAFEAMLAAEGYEVFHPQEHPIEVQVARYKAARRVISTDCSALHLAAFFARPGDSIAILARRPGPTIQDFARQYGAFAGIAPLVIDRLGRLHHLKGAHLAQMSEVYAEVDYPALTADLVAAGFLDGPPAWTPPDRAALDAELAHWAAAQDSEMEALAATAEVG